MKRMFLTSTEMAVFCQAQNVNGPHSAVVYGPCEKIEDAWDRASDGYDMDHIVKVRRIDLETGTTEDVTATVATDLAYMFAERCLPHDAAPYFVDLAEIEAFTDGFRLEQKRLREQCVA